MKPPAIFLAEFKSKRSEGLIYERLQELIQLGWGRMWVTGLPRLLPGEPWAFDNGAYRAYSAGTAFDEAAFLARMRLAHTKVERPPLVAVAPDIVAGGEVSLAFSKRWLRRLPSDWPWFLAVQDGMQPAVVERELGQFAGLFLGGTDRFKDTAPIWARLAHDHGKQFHYGRAGTPRKLDLAYLIQADSADSSYPLWTNARWREFINHWRSLTQRHQGQPVSLYSHLEEP